MSRIRIGVSLNIGSHAWYERQVAAEVRRANDLGAEVLVRDADDDPSEQIDQIHDLLSRGVRALIVSATRPGAIGEALDAAQTLKVPVIAESIALDHPAVVAEVRVDDVQAGLHLGRAVGAALTERGTEFPVPEMTLVGFSSLREGHDRERGFVEGFRSVYPDIRALYVDGRAQASLARDAIVRVVGSGGVCPDVIFGVDDESVVGARLGYAQLGVDVKPAIAATYGISPPSGPSRIDDGTITFGAAMFPEWHGETLIDLAIAAIEGKPHPRLVQPPSAVVTASGTPTGWDRFYSREGDDFVLDREAVRSLT